MVCIDPSYFDLNYFSESLTTQSSGLSQSSSIMSLIRSCLRKGTTFGLAQKGEHETLETSDHQIYLFFCCKIFNINTDSIGNFVLT